MSLEIVTCPSDRVADLLATAQIPFSETVSPEFIARIAPVIEPDRFLTALDGQAIVGTAGVFSFRLAVPGGERTIEAPCGGISWVTVLPTHRRQGLLRGMMRRMLDDCRARGEPLAALWASEAPIYQRFGFGLASLSIGLEAETRAMAFTRDRPQTGRFRLVEIESAAPIVAPIYAAAGRQRAGFVARPDAWWPVCLPDPEKNRRGGEVKRVVVYETDDGPEAYAVYNVKADWNVRGTAGQLTVQEAIGATARGTRELWRWLFDVDLVRSLRAWRLPPDHPLFGLVAEPRRLGATIGDGLWLRIVDVAAALEARHYRADGRLTLELRDEFCPWNAGCWTLDVAGGAGRARLSSARPDLVLDTNDLAALYLGGTSAAALAGAGRVVERRAGAVELADRVFPTPLQPWCPAEF